MFLLDKFDIMFKETLLQLPLAKINHFAEFLEVIQKVLPIESIKKEILDAIWDEDIIEYLFKNQIVVETDISLIELVVKNGNVPVLKFLFNKDPDLLSIDFNPDKFKREEKTLIAAAQSGSVAMIRYLVNSHHTDLVGLVVRDTMNGSYLNNNSFLKCAIQSQSRALIHYLFYELGLLPPREQIEMLIASSCINNIQFFAYIKSYLVAPHLRVPLLALANGLDKLSVSRLFRLYHSIGNEEHQKTLGAHIEQRGLNHNDLKKLIKLLDMNDPFTTDALLYYSGSQFNNNFSTLKFLLDLGIDVNLTNERGESALLHAVLNDGVNNIVAYLVECGADIYQSNHIGETTLTVLASRRQMEQAKYLLALAKKSKGNYLLLQIGLFSQNNSPKLIQSAINGAQKNIIEGTLKFLLDDITSSNTPEGAIRIYQSLLSTFVPSELIHLKATSSWESIEQIIKFVTHPCPQNRASGDPSAFWHSVLKGHDPETVEEKKGLVHGVFKGKVYCYQSGFGSVIFTETEGILGLTARNDNSAPHITKEAVVFYIKQLIQEEIYRLEQGLQSLHQPKEKLNQITTAKIYEYQGIFFSSTNKLMQFLKQSNLTEIELIEQMITSRCSPPKGFNQWSVRMKTIYHKALIETLEYLIDVEGLLIEEALIQMNQLSWMELSVLKELYASGIRSNHLLDLRGHFPYDDDDVFVSLSDLLLNKNLTLDEALTKVKEMNSSDFLDYVD